MTDNRTVLALRVTALVLAASFLLAVSVRPGPAPVSDRAPVSRLVTRHVQSWRGPTTTSTTEAPVIEESPREIVAPVTYKETQAPVTTGSTTGWAGVRECESGGDYGYDDGTYSGAYNFDDQTWRSVGGSGSASDASADEQDARAQRLYDERGSAPWPNCGRHLG